MARSSRTRFFREAARLEERARAHGRADFRCRAEAATCAVRNRRDSWRIWSRRISRNPTNIRPNWMQIHAGDLDELEPDQRGRRASASPGLIVWPEAPGAVQLAGCGLRARVPRQIARGIRRRFSGRRGGLETGRGREVGGHEQRRAAQPLRPAHFHVRQNSSGAVRRIRPAAANGLRSRASSPPISAISRRVRCYGVGRLPERAHSVLSFVTRRFFPTIVRRFTAGRRRTADQYFERRMVRPFRRSRAAFDDGARARRRKPALAAARHQQRLHRLR